MMRRHDKGFTLVEALVALTILTVGLVPAFIQASNAVALSGSVRNSLIAAHLASEGAEIARSLRDADWAAGRPFGQSLSGCDAGCRVQWDSQAMLPLTGNPPLLVDQTSGLYQYATGNESRFSRQIFVTTVSAQELKLDVRVSWNENSGPKEFAIEYRLFNWLQ